MDANAQPPPENRAPWLDEAERAPIRDSLAKDTDLAVIGGGVAGVSVAFHAAGRGLSVVLLERDRLASRASGRNDGQILLGLGEHLNRILGQWGTDRGLRLWRFLEENHARLAALIRDERLPCAFVQDGGLRLADSESEMRELSESAAILARERIEHRLLDRAGVRDALPLAEGYLGGLFLPGEAVFDPAAFVLALAGLAREHGLRVREESPVTAVSGDAGAFQLELGDSEELRCKVLVHATAALAPELDRSGLLARLVFPFRGQLLASFPLEDELLAAMPRWAMSSHFCSEYFRVHE
ncbi:MAG: NAD(P)/FAD-dependent oxidoreductase, partial [Planctomycetota bacterium]